MQKSDFCFINDMLRELMLPSIVETITRVSYDQQIVVTQAEATGMIVCGDMDKVVMTTGSC